MKKMTTILALSALIAMPMAASAQGFYEWSISESTSDADVNTGANPGNTTVFLNLWLRANCRTGGASAGLQAAEFQLTAGTSDWSILAFNTANGFLNAGNATDLLLATPCTSDGTVPIRAGQIIISASGNPGRIGFTSSSTNNKAVGVDCDVFAEHAWPGLMRFIGYKTTDSTPPGQDHGNGCGTVSVEDSSWGSVKSLYR